MRQYVVQAGDSPAKIAAQHAGCPKCARDLIAANPQKKAVTYPNGFVTFTDLRAGETLNLPDKWFSAEFDALPPSYFKALPHADGVTRGLGDQTTDDAGMSAGGKLAIAAVAAATIIGVTYAVTEHARHA